jgi:dienelactone hydrolase
MQLVPNHAKLATLLLVACGAASAQTEARPAVIEFPLAPSPAWVSNDTPQGSGPYPAVMEVDAGLPTHTVYRPAKLQALGAEKLPIVAWGNGACVNMGNRFRFFLSEIASQGFLVVAIGPIGPKEGETARGGSEVRVPPYSGSPAAAMAAAAAASQPVLTGPTQPAQTTSQQLLDAVEWAQAENTRAGSPYRGRIATDKVAVMGQSCGGVQAIAAARDPRVTTLGVWNSGLFNDDWRGMTMAAAPVNKRDLKRLHGTAIYITGEPSDVAFKNAQDDFAQIDGIPVFHAWREKTGHTGTYREPGGGAFGPVGVAWLRWQLKGDEKAAMLFKGKDCGLCTQTEWHVQKKRID